MTAREFPPALVKDGKPLTERLSSVDKPTDRWEEDNEVVRQWAASWGHIIPRPNEPPDGFMD